MATSPDDPSVVVDQIVKIVKVKNPDADQADIEAALGDLRVLTTITGASTLELDVIDPEWILVTSGFLAVGDDNRLDAVDLNYPLGSDYWWRLAQVDGSTDKTVANFTLTFEDRAVSYCREIKGQKSWSRSQFTRAQAIKAMTADAVTQPPKLLFISPELDIVQTIQA